MKMTDRMFTLAAMFCLLNSAEASEKSTFSAKISDACIIESVARNLLDKKIWHQHLDGVFIVREEDWGEFTVIVEDEGEKCMPIGLTRCYDGKLLVQLKKLLNEKGIKFIEHPDEHGVCFVFSDEDIGAVDILELRAMKEVFGIQGDIQREEM